MIKICAACAVILAGAARATEPGLRRASGDLAPSVLAGADAYREARCQGYAWDALTIARLFDESEAAARDLASLRAGHILVTGTVVRYGAQPRELPERAAQTEPGSYSIVLETNRAREVWCQLPSNGVATALAPGAAISVSGRVLAPRGSALNEPVLIDECRVVWSQADATIAAATVLWCFAHRAPRPPGDPVDMGALDRGAELLAQRDMREPPTGCNEAVHMLLNDCSLGVNRRDCSSPWVNEVLRLLDSRRSGGDATRHD